MLDLTPLIRLWGRYRHRRLAAMRVAGVQARVLRQLLHAARGTRFGRDHGFDSIRTVEDFQRRVPLRDYRAFWSEYWEPAFPVLRDVSWPGTVPWFALTSGTTTGATKYIPYTAEMVRDARWGMLDLFAHHLAARPASRAFGGCGVMLSGDIALHEEAPGVFSGAVSGITAARVPGWLAPRVLPDRETAAIADWHAKTLRLAGDSLAADVRVMGGAPNWLLLFLDQVARLAPDRPARLAEWYPGLELIVHGGVNFAPYRARFRELMQGSRAETREAYSASEGFFAVADRGDGEGLRLIADLGIFYEFVPVAELGSAQPTRHWAATAETGVDYALVVSTCAGAWAYILGDTVRLLSTDPIRLVVTGRTSYLLSAFGEHVIEDELARAVTEAAGAIGTGVADYSVSPVMPGEDRPSGGHRYVVECSRQVTAPVVAARFAETLDACLQRLNADYREQRHRDFGLRPPEVVFARPGCFAAWMKRRGRLGGQNKVPRIINDAALAADLHAFADAWEREAEG